MQKERKKKISKMKLIPKVGSAVREKMLELLTGLDDYQKALERGLRFFTEEQLLQIEDKYKGGMTWEEIDTIMSSQGTILKQATFRKYMQDEIIPKAKGDYYVQDGVIQKAKGYKSRAATYDCKIIRHLNFVNFYYKVTDTPMIDFLTTVLDGMEISEYDASESQLANGSSGYLYVDIIKEIAGFPESYASEAIEKALSNRDDKDKALNMLNNIREKYIKYIDKDVDEFCKYLKSTIMLITQIPDENQDNSEVVS